MAIGEVARRSGVPASTIRYYESVGVLARADRVSGRRVYDEDVLRQLRAIGVAQQAGFTLREVGTLMQAIRQGAPPSQQWRRLAEQKLPELNALIERVQSMRQVLEHGLACDCRSLEGCALRAC